MKILRRYQLDIIFLFFAIGALLWTSYFVMAAGRIDPHDYEWYAGAPLIFFYVWLLARIRGKVSLSERRNLTTKSLVYWIALGIIIFASYLTPLPASQYWSINVLFIIFTLFLADSYWDFRKLTIRNLFKKEL